MSSSTIRLPFPHLSHSQRNRLAAAIAILLAAIGGLFYLRPYVFSEAYLPHAFCFLQRPALVWTHVISDTVIGLSYVAISITLAFLVRKTHREIPFRWVFVAFGLFIVTCGGTHFMEAVTVWVPVYVFSAVIKVLTGIASGFTAVALPFVVPHALSIIREARVSDRRRQELESALQERNIAQVALRESNDRLEHQVQQRTSELARANASLASELEDRARIQTSLFRLAAIVESSNDAIIGKDLSGTITSWNLGAEKMYGYRAEEVVGKPVTILVPDDQVDEIARILMALARGEHIEGYETTRITKAGHHLYVSLTISTVCNSKGTITGASTIARDVTARKRAEDDLKRSEARFRILIEQAPDGIFVTDARGYFLDVNPSGARMLGYSPDEICRLNIADLIEPEDAPRLAEEIERLADGNVRHSEWRIHRKNGSSFEGEMLGKMLPGGFLQAFVRDITDRKQAAAALRASEAQLRSIVENAPYGIYRTVAEGGGRFVFVNPAMVKILGYDSAEEVLALSLESDVYSATEDPASILASMRSPWGYANLELHWRKKDGKELTLSSSGRMVRTADEQEFFESIAEDVTERRLLERQFRQAQKMEAIGRLAGGVSHDVNNILGVVTGYSEIALEKLGPDHPALSCIHEIGKAASRAANLTRQLLMFSRQQMVFPKVIDLNVVVNNTMTLLSRTIGEDVTLTFNAGKPLGSVRADVGQIEQILMNLVVNARDAMPDGGQITIETCDADLDESYRRSHEPVIPGPYVMLSVSDTGCGMDEVTKSNIFEPFFTTKEPGKGTGLGLSTVYGIVKQSSGFIWVYSEVGRGANFKIYLPRIPERAEKLPEAVEPDVIGGTETILLVEDDECLRSVTRTLLTSVGYEVLEAGTPNRAIEIAQERGKPIDLLLTDVIMPSMSGPEVSLKLKALLPELNVVFMSGYAGDALANQMIRVPDIALLVKPFSRAALLTTVRKALQERIV